MVQVGTKPLEQVDLSIHQGSDTSFPLRYYQRDDAGAPVAQDFTGWTARAQLRGRVGEDPVWAELTVGDGFTLTHDATSLTITLLIPHAVTEDPAWDSRTSGVWDLELVRADGWVIPLLAGRVTVTHDVTR